MVYPIHPISRKAFKVTACIDWMDVVICTSRPTQFRHLQAALKEITGEKLWIAPLDKRKREGDVATAFRIRFGDDLANNLPALQRALDKLAESYPLTAEPTIGRIEVSCDFWHKGNPAQRTSDLLAMTYRLQSSLFAPGRKPRQFDPDLGTKGENRFMDDGTRLDPNLNFRVGNKDDAVSWQAYFKKVDRKVPLPEAKWRARVEVTLQGNGLQRVGLDTLADLRDYDFAKFCRFFRFRRPIEPERLAKGSKLALKMIELNRKLHDATPQRGMHSFRAIGRQDKWRRTRAESRHIEADRELQGAVKGAMRRMSI